jgi:predicted NUDIX family NTP pyrophosphohydrolase
MAKQSAGILVYRKKQQKTEVLLGHPGGPFWAKKDKGAWSIPKGEFDAESPQQAARREFAEEIGQPAPEGELIDLGTIKTKSGKTIYVWAVQGEIDATKIISNTFDMEWPPKSGKHQQIPEIDRAGWFELGKAKEKLVIAQAEFIDRLAEKLGVEAQASEEPQTSLF